jgi:oligopeptide transport system permease protein
MTVFLVRRLILLVAVWLAVYSLTFALFKVTPGGPWDREKPIPRQAQELMDRKFGLDRPLAQQYLDYLVGVVTRFDLGPSYRNTSRGVADIIGDFLPVSATIGAIAMLLATVIGVPLGVVAAVRRGGVVDFAALLGAVGGLSVPSFVVGPLLIWWFALGTGWFPPGGIESWTGYVLPAVTLSLVPMATLARATRAIMVEILDTDFVRTARAKGLTEHIVLRRHALRNGLVPIVTLGGVLLAEVLVGSFYVETVFAVPGIGRFFVTSVTNRDYPVLMGVTLMLTTIVVLTNLVADLASAALDPRARVA